VKIIFESSFSSNICISHFDCTHFPSALLRAGCSAHRNASLCVFRDFLCVFCGIAVTLSAALSLSKWCTKKSQSYTMIFYSTSNKELTKKCFSAFDSKK